MTVQIPNELPSHSTEHGRVARWAVGLSQLASGAGAAAIITYAAGYFVGGPTAVEDNWLGRIIATMMLTAIAASVIAFAAGLVAKIKGERWVMLWLPLLMFPALFAFLSLGELFWWE